VAPPGIPLPRLGPTLELALDMSTDSLVTDGRLPKKTIVISFDDGPHRNITPALLKILAEEDVWAQFFMIGENVVINTNLVKTVASLGHEVGCHSYTHPDLRRLPVPDAIREIEDGFLALESVLGHTATFFRFPYGAWTRKLRAHLAMTQTPEFFWNIDTWDWKHRNPQDLLPFALSQVEEQGFGVILFHDIQPQTLAVLPAFLRGLKVRNYHPAIFRPKSPRVRPVQ
jgi:peptidoglycan-N-acetylglucosamine deacetylase